MKRCTLIRRRQEKYRKKRIKGDQQLTDDGRRAEITVDLVQSPRARAKHGALGSAPGQRLAGDTVTRWSTSGVIVRRRGHLLRDSSTAQNVIGLSSAESEYHAITKGGCSGLGLQSLFADWNLKLQLSLHTDSSSAKAFASRRGVGKSTRHRQTRMLWLQVRVPAKHLRVVKVATESNPTDMLTLTRALGRSKVEEFCAEIGQTEPHAK